MSLPSGVQPETVRLKLSLGLTWKQRQLNRGAAHRPAPAAVRLGIAELCAVRLQDVTVRAPIATSSGRRLALAGVAVNTALALARLQAGIFGRSYSLIADAAEFQTDIAGSAVICVGLRYAAVRPTSVIPAAADAQIPSCQ